MVSGPGRKKSSHENTTHKVFSKCKRDTERSIACFILFLRKYTEATPFVTLLPSFSTLEEPTPGGRKTEPILTPKLSALCLKPTSRLAKLPTRAPLRTLRFDQLRWSSVICTASSFMMSVIESTDLSLGVRGGMLNMLKPKLREVDCAAYNFMFETMYTYILLDVLDVFQRSKLKEFKKKLRQTQRLRQKRKMVVECPRNTKRLRIYYQILKTKSKPLWIVNAKTKLTVIIHNYTISLMCSNITTRWVIPGRSSCGFSALEIKEAFHWLMAQLGLCGFWKDLGFRSWMELS